MLSEPLAVSLRAVSSIGVGPATATVAVAKTSPATVPLPLSVTGVLAPPAIGPKLHENCVVFPEGVNTHAGVDGLLNVNGTSPVNVPVSERLGTSTCELFVTVRVQVASAFTATGLGAAATAHRKVGSPSTQNGEVEPAQYAIGPVVDRKLDREIASTCEQRRSRQQAANAE